MDNGPIYIICSASWATLAEAPKSHWSSAFWAGEVRREATGHAWEDGENLLLRCESQKLGQAPKLWLFMANMMEHGHLLSGKLLHSYGKSPFVLWETHDKWSCSIAMLNYQRVTHLLTHESHETCSLRQTSTIRDVLEATFWKWFGYPTLYTTINEAPVWFLSWGPHNSNVTNWFMVRTFRTSYWGESKPTFTSLGGLTL